MKRFEAFWTTKRMMCFCRFCNHAYELGAMGKRLGVASPYMAREPFKRALHRAIEKHLAQCAERPS